MSRRAPQLYRLYPSQTAGKKYDIYLPNPHTGRTKKVAFGAKGYSDYTKHRDRARREQYRSRHRNDRIDDPFSAGFWSWYVLWGDSTSLKACTAKAVRLAKRLI